MRKSEEIADPNSCWNKAGEDEFVFVLLCRDPDIADVIRYWATKRMLREGADPKIAKAMRDVAEIDRIKRVQKVTQARTRQADAEAHGGCRPLLGDPGSKGGGYPFDGEGEKQGDSH